MTDLPVPAESVDAGARVLMARYPFEMTPEAVEALRADVAAVLVAAAGPLRDQGAATGGAALIAAERRRQAEQEGWTPEHDASHHEGELARAAACYALAASAPFFANRIERGLWPPLWDFKSADPVRMLAKAGALIAAEIDRLLREETPDAV
jgi:hypothetical protein